VRTISSTLKRVDHFSLCILLKIFFFELLDDLVKEVGKHGFQSHSEDGSRSEVRLEHLCDRLKTEELRDCPQLAIHERLEQGKETFLKY